MCIRDRIEQAPRGFVKLIADAATRQLVGGVIAGAHASDWIGTVAQAVSQHLTIDDCQRVIMAHPTWSEALHEALMDFDQHEMCIRDRISELGALFPDPLGKLRDYCFLVYCLFSIPCIMTLNALRQEYGTKLMLKSIAIMLALPYAVSLLLFQLGRLLFWL